MANEVQPGWGDKGYDDPRLKVMSGNAPVETLFHQTAFAGLKSF